MADTKNYETAIITEKGSTSSQLTMSLAGGIIGAAIGYMVTSGNSKMLTEGMDMEKLSSKGSELSEAVMEKSRNLLQSVVSSATKLFEKQEGQSKEGLPGQENGSINGWVERVEEMLSQLVSDGTGQMLVEKKEQLQDRLGNIEEMLSKMVEEKGIQSKKNDQENEVSKGTDNNQQDESKGNSGTENKDDRHGDNQENSGDESKKKTLAEEKQGEAKSYNQDSRNENQEKTTSSHSNTSNKGYTMLNVDEDTHNLLEGLEKDV